MAYNFLPYRQDEQFLMPPSVRDWVDERSLARFINDVVEALYEEGELASFFEGRRADGWGRAAYHPVMMVKVLLYAYCLGVTSSRRIEAELETDVAFRYLAANHRPDHRTLSDFRKDSLEALQGLFVKIVALCAEAGMVKLGRVALDGRRVSGNAALDQNRTKAGLATEVAKILAEAEEQDREEDEKYGPDARGDELPEEMQTKEGRLSRLREAQARLEAREKAAQEAQQQRIEAREQEEAETGKRKRGRKPKPPEEVADPEAKVNVTDPESSILKARQGWKQGYNGQAMVETDSQVIVAEAATAEANDVQQLEPMLERCEQQAGAKPAEVLADAGYWSERNAALEDDQTELFIATNKDWKQRKAAREKGSPRGRIPKNATVRDRMERKLLTKRGRAAYAQRGSTVEPVFGQMVMRGLTRFLLRGLKKVQGEWSLWCTSHNLLKLWRRRLQLDAP